MARPTVGRRIPRLVFRLVARRAGGAPVGTPQRKIRQVVIERRGVEICDIGLATAVLGVARAAGRIGQARRPAVEAPGVREIRRNLFVAFEA
jgi:hypothetical protein